MLRCLMLILCGLFITNAYAVNSVQPAVTQMIPLGEIQGYANYPEITKSLILKAQTLTQKNLTYLYGSADPKQGGMDCSGTIFFLLQLAKLSDVPRSSNEMFLWVKQKGTLFPVTANDFTSPQFAKLKPGDLLFWEGTYQIKRDPPTTHVMLYLGKNAKNEPLMFGASDGRTYQGKKMWGVSVFDFKLPRKGDRARFVGYGCIPSLTCVNK